MRYFWEKLGSFWKLGLKRWGWFRAVNSRKMGAIL